MEKRFSDKALNAWKQVVTDALDNIGYSHVKRLKSSTKITKYLKPDNEGTGASPQTSQ